MQALKRSTYVRRLKETVVLALWPEIRKHLHDLEFCEDAAAEEVTALQLQKVNSLLQHFRSIDPVFRDLSDRGVSTWRLSSLSDLKQFPVITKDILRSYEADLAKLPYVARRGSTSGSTGRNFVFFQSRSMIRARSAAVRYCYERIGVDYWGDSKTVIWGQFPNGSLRSRLSLAARRRFVNSTIMSGFGLDDRTARSYLDTIAAARPALVEGYPNYLATLARAGLANGSQIRRYSPRAVVSAGEQLHDFQRATIEEWFGTRVFNWYGSREFGVIAHERPGLEGQWIPPTRFVVECASDNQLLITDLDNYAFPFIRYAIGDCGTLDSEFQGRQVITSLSGRVHDVIRAPSGREIPGQFWTLLSRTVPGIEEFQVVQTREDRVELRVTVSTRFNSDSESRLIQRFREFVGSEMELVVRRVPEIVPTAAGKRRFVIGLKR